MWSSEFARALEYREKTLIGRLQQDSYKAGHLLRRSLKRVHPSARTDLERLVRMMARGNFSLRMLNEIYSRSTPLQKEQWHTRYAKVFRDQPSKECSGHWRVDFEGKPVTLPLGGPDMWLEWDAALSLLGHELDIKRTYAALIRSELRPKLFLDVGANYGLHSLLFLVHGIPTVSVEPNSHCHSYFHRIVEMNGVTANLQPVALGDSDRMVQLWSPRTETWYGTTVDAAKTQIPSSEVLEVVSVRQTTLDLLVQEFELRPGLIKIDTEGAETGILRGSLKTLKAHRPTLIFESWPQSDRSELFSLLQSAEFSIFTLRSEALPPQELPGLGAFKSDPNTNFIAAPNESVHLLMQIL